MPALNLGRMDEAERTRPADREIGTEMEGVFIHQDASRGLDDCKGNRMADWSFWLRLRFWRLHNHPSESSSTILGFSNLLFSGLVLPSLSFLLRGTFHVLYSPSFAQSSIQFLAFWRLLSREMHLYQIRYPLTRWYPFKWFTLGSHCEASSLHGSFFNHQFCYGRVLPGICSK
ncbi:hypothetical protein K469DRAFT_241179 [Zopfia rhizophila CBS 207.26]|uniref:Uncharacterized protein n=1 Tax=Zopfia rhizophila CBS 207.26 TaxID=1314779 RepID=A0A6A6ERB6_9PEZI|nr:hypothetical protein K469DRAFT_241179 [Zopfia rhizophila CBS 207.26]